jgi:hypothetical protein
MSRLILLNLPTEPTVTAASVPQPARRRPRIRPSPRPQHTPILAPRSNRWCLRRHFQPAFEADPSRTALSHHDCSFCWPWQRVPARAAFPVTLTRTKVPQPLQARTATVTPVVYSLSFLRVTGRPPRARPAVPHRAAAAARRRRASRKERLMMLSGPEPTEPKAFRVGKRTGIARESVRAPTRPNRRLLLFFKPVFIEIQRVSNNYLFLTFQELSLSSSLMMGFSVGTTTAISELMCSKFGLNFVCSKFVWILSKFCLKFENHENQRGILKDLSNFYLDFV